MLAYYVEAVRRAAEEKSRLEGLVGAEARKPRWRRRVDSLRCLKGVDTATAADLVFEAGEFSRFRNARSFAAWVGLTPSEHSSGESDRRGAITKAGNKHLRKTLVLASIYFSPFSPTYFRQSRQRGCAGFANADAPLSASRLPPPSRPRRRWIRPSGGTTVPLS